MVLTLSLQFSHFQYLSILFYFLLKILFITTITLLNINDILLLKNNFQLFLHLSYEIISLGFLSLSYSCWLNNKISVGSVCMTVGSIRGTHA